MPRLFRDGHAWCSSATLVLALSVARAHACPDCSTARSVRARVFDAEFWPTLLRVALPWLVLVAILAVLHGLARNRASRSAADAEGPSP